MVFVDTAGWIALIHKRDMLHPFAVKVYNNIARVKQITTDAVVLETCNAFSHKETRHLALLFIEKVEECRAIGVVDVVHISEKLFYKGVDFFRAYADKSWSLTDCISMIVMNEKKIKQVFTSDRHFVQAGFEILLHKGI